MSRARGEDDARITVRLPRDLADALKALAGRNDRPINSEIMRAIREHLERAHDTQGD